MSCYSTKGQGRLATADPTQKRIPEAKRYRHVQSSLDTGKSQLSQQRKIDEMNQNYKFRKNEIFKRMKVTTFAQLVIQIHRIASFDADILDVLDDPNEQAPPPPQEPEVGGSGLNRVIHGMGELSVAQASQQKVVQDLPYLLLDVRLLEEHDQCRIISSHSYPYTQLSNSTNYETKDMYKFKNKEGRIIILFDNDETIAPNCATTLVQRGYDNIFILSGGMKIAHKIIPHGFLCGTPTQAITGVKPKGALQPATQDEFFPEDIDIMEALLDDHLESSKGPASASGARSASRRSEMSVSKGNPWK